MKRSVRSAVGSDVGCSRFGTHVQLPLDQAQMYLETNKVQSNLVVGTKEIVDDFDDTLSIGTQVILERLRNQEHTAPAVTAPREGNHAS